MFETFLLSVLSLLHLVTLNVVLWLARDYIKAKHRAAYITSVCTCMTMIKVDQLTDGFLEDAPAQQNDQQSTREAKLPSAELPITP